MQAQIIEKIISQKLTFTHAEVEYIFSCERAPNFYNTNISRMLMYMSSIRSLGHFMATIFRIHDLINETDFKYTILNGKVLIKTPNFMLQMNDEGVSRLTSFDESRLLQSHQEVKDSLNLHPHLDEIILSYIPIWTNIVWH